ncbi:MAG: hypothetical protein U0K35_10755, partial [Prevotella sp.]|nr:hypothetical protein [Prevotella sp.]
MRKTFTAIALAIAASLSAQNNYSGKFERSLSDVSRSVEKQFGVKLKWDVDTASKRLPYADFRIRPYSIEETLDNIC